MDVLLTLLILTVSLPTLHLYSIKNLLQFEDMIECTIPNSSPVLDFADYGCFCGFGGQGSPVDQLDRCCFTHDDCYAKAKILQSCTSLFDSPYTNTYDYQCDKITRTITCLASNDDCDMFICQCDKAAAECFAQSPYNASNNHLPSSVCSSASREISSFIITLVAFTVTLTICYSNKIPCNQ
ncbi:phospholipase A2-like isoform X1 [Megalobrama amblycephala]|uniref:phospholipase A2-like isoform X1 n=1 Tax=Megalobrama amblycephala TaxID=75352 RepID=UPI0020142894|nr:phospholipase A2-like isoform X1 [Megalobrama amblycephala]